MTIGRRDYETRRAARIERLRTQAERASQGSAASFERSRRIADGIPFGQPILVGHHSEKRHRRDARRIDDGMRKGVEMAKQADHLNRRADAAEDNHAISSDDPNAVIRLKEKLSELEQERDDYKAANKAMRKATDPAKALLALGWDDDRVRRVARRLDGTQVPSYVLSNRGAEIRRIQQRIKVLEAMAARPSREPLKIGFIEVREEDNRTMLLFPSKPAEFVRKDLKNCGFKWAPSSGAWQRMAKPGVWELAVRLARKYTDQDGQANVA